MPFKFKYDIRENGCLVTKFYPENEFIEGYADTILKVSEVTANREAINIRVVDENFIQCGNDDNIVRKFKNGLVHSSTDGYKIAFIYKDKPSEVYPEDLFTNFLTEEDARNFLWDGRKENLKREESSEMIRKTYHAEKIIVINEQLEVVGTPLKPPGPDFYDRLREMGKSAFQPDLQGDVPPIPFTVAPEISSGCIYIDIRKL